MKGRRWLALGFATFGLAAVGGGVAITWYLQDRVERFFTDADTIDRPVAGADPRDVLWRPPVDLPPAINSAGDEFGAAMSPDGQTLYFVRGRAGHDTDLWMSEKTATGWSDPAPVAALNTDADELDPQPSPDGTALYFCSNRSGGEGEYDLWVTRRHLGDWQEPVNLGPTINSPAHDYGPALTPDGTTLYFSSNREPAGDILSEPDFDLYAVDVTGQTEATPVDELNTPGHETGPTVSPVGDFLYFASDRDGGAGGFDLYRSRRIEGTHDTPRSLEAPVNTADDELDPAVVLEGFGLHFATNAATGDDYDLRYTTSREVFTRSETHATALDWRDLWDRLWPYLLWLGIIFGLLLAMARVLQKLDYRKLSLLTKCLMVSLLLHLLLMAGFAVWGVSSALSEWERPGQGMRVVLTSPSVGSQLAGQVRGEMTNVEIEAEMPPTETQDRPMPAAAADAAEVSTETMPVERTAVAETAASLAEATARETPGPETPRPVEAAAPTARVEAVAVETPTEAQRARAAEAAPAVTAATAAAATAQRADASRRAELTDATTSATMVAVAPAAVEAVPRSVVSASGHDAPRPSAEAAPAIATAVIEIDDVEPLEVGTPNETARGQSHEPAAAVTAATAATARAPRADTVSDTPRSSKDTVNLAQTVSGTAIETGSLAGDDTRRDAAASTPMLSEQESFLAVGGMTLELAMPTASGAPAENADHTAEPVAGAVAASAVAATAARASVMDTEAPSYRRTDVATSVTRVGGTSVVAVEGREASMRSPVRVREASDVERHDAMMLALPVLEESSVTLDTPVDMPADTTPTADRKEADRAAWAMAAAAAASSADRVHMDVETSVHDPATSMRPARKGLDAEPVELSEPDLPAVVMATLDLDLELPTMPEPPPKAYLHRAPDVREQVLEDMGGSVETEHAVALALDWLARHQSHDGRWDGNDFDDRCGHCSGQQRVTCDTALTALSVLCFVAADHTHDKPGQYREVVDGGLNWLLRKQKRDGDIMGGESMYTQGIVTIALAEAYGMTKDERLRDPLLKAIDFIWRGRNETVGGWRYRPGQVGDTSVLGWQVMALKSAQNAGIDVPNGAYDVARRWLNLVHQHDQPGIYAYQPRGNVTPAMVAEGMFIRQLLGTGRDDRRMLGSSDYILRNPPVWSEDANTYYWYYATLAMFQHQGTEWQRWNEQIKTVLLQRQHQTGRRAGSWDPDGRWAAVAGRVYQTAIVTLTLEVYYRYLPAFMIEQEVIELPE